MAIPRRLLIILPLLLAALLTLWKLDYSPFWNPDEGRYSAASYEMAFGLNGSQPDWVVPHLNGVARLNKPPLIYWTTAACFKLLGANEIAGRLPSALASIVVMLTLFFWGRAAFGLRTGVAASLVWATSAFPFVMGRSANTDMQLCAAICLACFGIFWSIESERKALAGMGAGVGMGLAMLSKGPVGVAFPLIIGAMYITATGSWKRVPWGSFLIAIGVAFVIAAPWYFLVEGRRPGWVRYFIIDENLGRLSGGKAYHKRTPPFFYLPVLLAGTLPWTGFVLASLGSFEKLSTRAGRTKLFLAIFAVFIVLFFSASGTKLVSYVLPAFPAIALFAAACIARFEFWNRFQRNGAVAFTVVLNLVLAIVVAFKPGVLVDGKILPQEVGAPWAFTFAGVMVLSSATLLLAVRRPGSKPVLAALSGSGFVMLGVLACIVSPIMRYEDGSTVFKELQPYLAKDDRVSVYLGFLPGGIVYAQRPVTFFEFKNTSGLDKTEIQNSAYFPPAEAIGSFVAQKPGRSFVISKGPIWKGASRGLWQWGRNNNWFLYANTRKTEDFSFEFVAPGKETRPSRSLEEVRKFEAANQGVEG